MGYIIGPLLPASQTTRPKTVSNVINTDLTANKQPKLSCGDGAFVERRYKDRRKTKQKALLNSRLGRDRRKHSVSSGIEIKV